MFNKFYWGTIRKGITAFGLMFNNIYIDRTDDDGNVVQTMRVPLSYAPTQKFIAKLRASPNSFEQSFQAVLPRMSFEVTNFEYDASRKVSQTQQVRIPDPASANKGVYQYAPTPWNINISLNIYGKNQDDTLQIVEQILPYFNPDYNLNLNSLQDLEIQDDLPISIQGISFADSYEGDLNDARMVIWTINFEMKLNFYGPTDTKGVIKRAKVNTYTNASMTANLMNYAAEVSPFTANSNSDYSVIEFIEEF